MTEQENIDAYLKEVARQFATGAATEHSYRPALQTLLSSAIRNVTVVNEPARIECGAPDILVRENGSARRPVGYVETKDVGDGDLDGNSTHREQFDRYKAELANIVFTDYLDFHFYVDGQFAAKCRIAEVVGNRIVPAAPEELERFAALLRRFAEVPPKPVTSPSRLARLMAGKARLLARATVATLGGSRSRATANTGGSRSCATASTGGSRSCATANTGGSRSRATEESTPLAQQYLAFRQWLVHDLDVESFADIYAQTIVYGMFAARFHDTTPEDFSRAEAASLVPRSNPLLRRLFRDLDEYVDESIAWIIDDLVALFAASDITTIMADYGRAAVPGGRDPLLHFYEDFLAAYDPGLRKQRGVWYTPVPVVRYIVRSIDEILRRVFGLPGGLADASKTRVRVTNDNRARKGDAKFVEREMHRVQLLDPALGTGTFIAEAVRLIRSKFAGQEGLWPGYVRDHLIPRLNGFEILMASYAMAHLKLDLLLSETMNEHTDLLAPNGAREAGGSQFTATENSDAINCVPPVSRVSGEQIRVLNNNAPPERLRIFLTNSLEEFSETTGTLWAMELSNESREANYVKRDCPVMVVLGNPPYSVSSSNKGEWIQRLIADYKRGLNEKKINLDDDYIKFIRLGQHYIDKNGEGILAYISNNSFLDGITHRRMRQSLMESFDEIYILDLHGNARKKETAPDGSKDENVFDIMQGVSINIFVRKRQECSFPEAVRPGESTPRGSGAPAASSLCRVFHAEVYGAREAKYAFLDAHDISSVDYKELHPVAPYYFFVPKDFALEEEYNKGFSVAELMPVNNSGIQTKRDDFVYQHSVASVERIVEAFRSKQNTEEIRNAFSIGEDGVAWSVEKARQDVAKNNGRVCEVLYHPFDKRLTYFTGVSSGFMARPRMPQSSHMLHENIAMLLVRNTRRENPFNFFVADTIVDKDGISGFDNCRFFPLYLYQENMGKMERVPNLNPEIVKKITAGISSNPGNPVNPVKESPTPEAIFHYIYAVLHTPAYRSRFREFLKVDFPRIPYPKSAEEFHRLAAIGERLVAVHLLKAPEVRDMFSPYATFPVPGDNRVEAVKTVLAAKNAESTKNLCETLCPLWQKETEMLRVHINATQYFDNVPAAAWEFHIGGYQPAQKWLKDRKGRTLSSDDLLHYKAIVAALVETRRLMDELD